MKKTFISLIILLFPLMLAAEQYTNMASLVQMGSTEAVFETSGIADKKADVLGNALRSLFHQLFYTGVEGVNDGKPWVVKENKNYTMGFFNSNQSYTFYVVERDKELKPVGGKVEKTGSNYRATYKVTIKLKKLLADMKTNKVFFENKSGVDDVETTEVRETENLVLPTVIVVPYTKQGESYAMVMQNDYDKRIAVAEVQKGFESRNVTTIDLQAKIDATLRRSQYEQNAATAESNDKQLLLTSGADVYVTVDINKDIQAEGSRVSLIMKAYETASGSILASTTATPARRFRTTATDALCKYAVEDFIKAFLDDICKNLKPANGTRVVLQFAIDGTSASTFDTPMGRQNYSLSNILRQWVRRNAYQGKYHLQGIVEESMIFDYVTIPPKDEDGLRMDAAQFGFLIEQYLKETENIDCKVRIDGNNILVTIF